ncbi:hypothetical protein Bca52824_052012 [Brassica carinata]|uniref:non-specific serine/threonine protein kinase n=1 Tax=Brassica carinata TaxID=52824 RepID=A0A8X7R370_BRACI|nr:hypothetical protein Bca52824_052012 [Brassica carinata]
MFTYEDLVKATDDFSSTNLLGKGGFGYVHKGVLQDGLRLWLSILKMEVDKENESFKQRYSS